MQASSSATVLPTPEVQQPNGHAASSRPKLYILDYGAGNVRSLANSIKKLGWEFEWIRSIEDFDKAEKLIFPGVGAFGQAMESLETSGLGEALKTYIASGRPYLGICVGMQVLFESSTESPKHQGLGVIPYGITKFSSTDNYGTGDGRPKAVPHMGWNNSWLAWEQEGADEKEERLMLDEDYYFVHSYGAILPNDQEEPSVGQYAYGLTRYGKETFMSSVKYKNVLGTQFHPEKSGRAGLNLLRRWLEAPVPTISSDSSAPSSSTSSSSQKKWQPTSPPSRRKEGTGLTNRIVACLDVRSNDQGDLIVTKGDQYDVREKSSDRNVRNLGKPVELAQKYYQNGADEICFLNITSFRSSALLDQPMLEVVKAAAETVFVPMTIGGGIKDTIDPDGTKRSALEVAGAYFRSGADKVSIGSEAVFAVEELLERESRGIEPVLTGKTGIETISKGYGAQAVVVSIDPKRVYLDTSDPNWLEKVDPKHRACVITGESSTTRTKAEEEGKAWWYQCTISGGRGVRDLDVIQLAKGVERLGAGELLLNSVDRDGSGKGFDLDLVRLVKENVSIPVVTSSGAGSASDFVEVFAKTGTEAALAAGIFHRGEVGIDEVKESLEKAEMPVRISQVSILFVK